MKIFIYILLISSSVVYSADVRKPSVQVEHVEFYGVSKSHEHKVKEWFDIKESSVFRLQLLEQSCKKVLNEYGKIGMPFTKIDSVIYFINADSSKADIHVYLNEGGIVKTGNIQLINPDTTVTTELKERFESAPGQDVSVGRIESDIDDALTQLEKDGRPFGRFRLKAINLDSVDNYSEFNVGFETSIGPRLVIQEIQLAGNKVTKDHVIIRETRIKPGDIYNETKVKNIRTRLMRLGFFQHVDEPAVFLADKDKGGLLIRVSEGNASTFDGVIGYNPGTTDEKGYFTGLIDISLGNLFGTGRSLKVHWQKRDQKTQDIEFHYKEPWIAGFPVHAGFGFEQLIQDTTYVQRQVAVDVSMPLFENLSAFTKLSRLEISPDSTGSYLLGIPRSRTLNAAIGISYDTRDDLLNPRQGAFYETSIQAGKKKNLGPDDLVEAYQLKKNINNKQISLDIEFYIPLFKRQVFALSFHGRQITSNEQYIPVPDQYRLGGARTLRGYREDQFRGSSVAWSNVEYRYILGRRSRAFLFADHGYYTSLNESGKTEAYKIGYGFGFRLETGLGIMGIDYGFGKGEGDGLFSGKIHVGLINEF